MAKDYLLERLQQQITRTPKSWPFVFPHYTNLHRVVGRIMKKAGITKIDVLGAKIWSHSFRHTFGTETQAQTGDLLMTKQAMGHKQIKSTLIYTHNKLKIKPVNLRLIVSEPEPEPESPAEESIVGGDGI